MRRSILCAMLLVVLPIVNRAEVSSAAAAISVNCSVGTGAGVTALAGKGHTLGSSALDNVFARLDKQPHVQVWQRNCGVSVVSLQYLKPNRMRSVDWLNVGMNAQHIVRQATETQVGTGFALHGRVRSTKWVGMGVTAHRMLLPDAWHGITKHSQVPLTFYTVWPPIAPIHQLSVRLLNQGKQQLWIEQWSGLLYSCPPGLDCAAPIPDPRNYALFTAVLRVNRATGLPASLVTVVTTRSRGRLQTLPISQATFLYGGSFSISLVSPAHAETYRQISIRAAAQLCQRTRVARQYRVAVVGFFRTGPENHGPDPVSGALFDSDAVPRDAAVHVAKYHGIPFNTMIGWKFAGSVKGIMQPHARVAVHGVLHCTPAERPFLKPDAVAIRKP